VHELFTGNDVATGIEVKRFLETKLFRLALVAYLGLVVCNSWCPFAKAADQVAAVGKAPDAAPNSNDKKPYAKEAVEHYNRGIELHTSGFMSQAISEYRAAIEADPRMEEAFSNLGVIYAAQHNYAKAKDAFTEALKLKPNRPTTLNGLGTVLYAQHKFDEAKDKWLQAVTIDPNFSSAYYNMGNAYESENKLQEAKKAFAQALSVTPTMADAYYRLGVIMYKEHHYAQAGAMLRRALLFAPEGEFANDARRMLKNIERELDRSETTAKETRSQPAKSTRITPPAAKEKASTTGDGKSKSPNMFIQPGQDKGSSENESK